MTKQVGTGRALLVIVPVALSGCGDADGGVRRGYTKAPLERPGLFIEAENRTSMDVLGSPIENPSVSAEPVVAPDGAPPPEG